jgi:hypothetical protein
VSSLRPELLADPQLEQEHVVQVGFRQNCSQHQGRGGGAGCASCVGATGVHSRQGVQSLKGQPVARRRGEGRRGALVMVCEHPELIEDLQLEQERVDAWDCWEGGQHAAHCVGATGVHCRQGVQPPKGRPVQRGGKRRIWGMYMCLQPEVLEVCRLQEQEWCRCAGFAVSAGTTCAGGAGLDRVSALQVVVSSLQPVLSPSGPQLQQQHVVCRSVHVLQWWSLALPLGWTTVADDCILSHTTGGGGAGVGGGGWRYQGDRVR